MLITRAHALSGRVSLMDQGASRSPPPASSTWIAAVAVICVGIIAYGVFYSTNAYTDLAYLIGYSLPPAIVLTAIVRWVWLRGQGVRPVLISFASIFVSLLLCWQIAAERQRLEAIAAVNSMQTQAARAAATPPDEQVAVDTRPVARGPFGEMERLMLGLIGEMAEQQNDYSAELTAIGWDNILDAARLRADPGLKRTLPIISQAEQLVDKYEARYMSLLGGLDQRIQQIDVPTEVKRSMSTGLARGLEKARPVIEEQWRIEREIVAQVKGMAVLLRDPRTWEMEGDMFLFEQDSDVDEYNARQSRLVELITRQEANRQQMMGEFQQNMDELKRQALR
jgi:hypothetical protein